MNEITDEDIELLKHKDFKNKKHDQGCTCGYCESKKWGKQQRQLRKEFNNRIKTLKLDEKTKEELYVKFIKSIENGFKCAYCAEKMDLEYETELSYTFDHVLSRKRGGKDDPSNIEIVCRNCNLMKGEKDVDWFLANLDRLKQRKLKRELFKARQHPDDRIRESYKDIFKRTK